MSTICQANGCTWATDRFKLMCPNHWRMLSSDMQGAINTAYRAHPTRAERLKSAKYLEACATAVEFIAAKEDKHTRNSFRNLADHIRAGKLKGAQP